MKQVKFIAYAHMGLVLEPANVISIGDPGAQYRFPVQHKRMLELRFDDVEQDMGPGYAMFDYILASKVLSFVKECGNEDILVHCYAGKSRSAAIAKYLHEHRGYFLDLSYPCLGHTQAYNKEVYRLLRFASAMR